MARLSCVLGARLLGPDLEGQGTRDPEVPGCGPLTSRMEVAIDESVGRQEALRLWCRLNLFICRSRRRLVDANSPRDC